MQRTDREKLLAARKEIAAIKSELQAERQKQKVRVVYRKSAPEVVTKVIKQTHLEREVAELKVENARLSAENRELRKQCRR